MYRLKKQSAWKSYCSGFSANSALWISSALLLVTNSSFAAVAPSTNGITGSPIKLSTNLNQERSLRGVVQDSKTGELLSGVTVKVVGTNKATSTNSQGEFDIKVNTNEVLEISYVGYEAARITVNANSKNIKVDLVHNLSDLEEVVVTGYGTQRKKDLTGAVSVVNVDGLKSQPAASAVEGLQGRAPGVQIINDGAPGSTPQIKIRGYSTINNNEPLYIIDGVPFEGKLSWLNQNDIETMQVLKDASAASIYGARANNGVVIITTKTGKIGKPQINLDSYVGIQVPQSDRFPKMLTPQQLVTMMNGVNGTSETLPEYLLAGSVYGNNITAADADPAKYNYSRDAATFYQITKANKEGTDWFKEITRTAPTQNYQLSATGGSENATYATSVGYLGQKGTIIHSSFDKFNVRSNTQFKAFNGKLRFGENMQYAYTKGVGMGVNPNTAGGYQGDESVVAWAYRIQTIVPVYDIMGNFAGTRGGYGNGQNPVAWAYRAKDDTNKSNFFFGNAFAETDILAGLTLRTSFGLKYENYNGKDISYPNFEFAEGSFNNGLSEYFGYNTEWTWTNTLNYKKTFDKHNLNVLLGTEAIDNRSRDLSAGRNNFFVLNSLDYFYLNAGTTDFRNGSSGSLGSMFSIFGKVDYSYDDRYILSATVRRDGSSNFGPSNKYGVFPGISGAWRLSSEEFMKSVTWVNDLKIRAGYGVTGNQRIPAYNYLDRYAMSIAQSSYPIAGTVQSGLWLQEYANPEVKWEQVNAFNIGLDFSLFQGDFDGSFDYYDKKTNDMLFRVPQPATATGRGTPPYINIGNMRNHGVELALGYHYGRRQNKEFKLDISGTLAKNVNEVIALAPSVASQIYGNFRSISTTILKPGESFGSFYGYQVAGVYKDAADVANSPNYGDGNARPGGLKYMDINDDGVINDLDRTIIGNPHPDFVYSLGLNATYKNFDASLFFYGSQGNDVFNMTRYFTDFNVFSGSKSDRLLDAWSPTNMNSSIPSLTSNASSYEYATSSYYVEDASFLKLKNVQIGYTFPVQKVFGQNTGLSKLRVYVGATNLFTITKYTGLDPEISATPSDYPAIGVDLGIYPQSRQYLFGLSLGF